MKKTLMEQFTDAKSAAQTIIDGAKADDRNLTDDEAAKVDEFIETATKAKASNDREVKSAANLAALGEPMESAPNVPAPILKVTESKSIGQRFIDSPQFKSMTGGFGSDIPASAAVIPGVESPGFKALITSPAQTIVDQPQLVEPSRRPLTLMDAFTTQIVTNGNTIQFVTGALSVNAAAVVAEGAVKPESTITFSELPVTLKKIAHWVPVTTEALADHPYMMGLIDTELVYGVQAKVESEVITDLDAWSGLGAQVFSTNIITTLALAKAKAEEFGMPNGILLNPADAVQIDLAAGSDGHFYGAGPFGGGNSSLWGLPVFRSYAVAAGTAYVGDLRQIIVHYREGVTVSTGWQNTQFIENKLTVLAEARIGVGVRRAPAVVKAITTGV